MIAMRTWNLTLANEVAGNDLWKRLGFVFGNRKVNLCYLGACAFPQMKQRGQRLVWVGQTSPVIVLAGSTSRVPQETFSLQQGHKEVCFVGGLPHPFLSFLLAFCNVPLGVNSWLQWDRHDRHKREEETGVAVAPAKDMKNASTMPSMNDHTCFYAGYSSRTALSTI